MLINKCNKLLKRKQLTGQKYTLNSWGESLVWRQRLAAHEQDLLHAIILFCCVVCVCFQSPSLETDDTHASCSKYPVCPTTASQWVKHTICRHGNRTLTALFCDTRFFHVVFDSLLNVTQLQLRILQCIRTRALLWRENKTVPVANHNVPT